MNDKLYHFSDNFFKKSAEKTLINNINREGINRTGTETAIFLLDKIRTSSFLEVYGEAHKRYYAKPFLCYGLYEYKLIQEDIQEHGRERNFESSIEITFNKDDLTERIVKLKTRKKSTIKIKNDSGKTFVFKKVFNILKINNFNLNLAKKTIYDLKLEIEKIPGLTLEYDKEAPAVEIIQFTQELPNKNILEIYVRDHSWDGCGPTIGEGDVILLQQRNIVEVKTLKDNPDFNQIIFNCNLIDNDKLNLYEIYNSFSGFSVNIHEYLFKRKNKKDIKE